MEKEREPIIGIIPLPEISLAPSEKAMKLVYEQFRDHGINLHIDVGADSIDFVTGKKWGALSFGNKIDYSDQFFIEGNDRWETTVRNNFSDSRSKAFHHVLFIPIRHLKSFNI
jgi:hypothetical protein